MGACLNNNNNNKTSNQSLLQLQGRKGVGSSVLCDIFFQVLRIQALQLKLSKLGPWLPSLALGYSGRCRHSQDVRAYTRFPNWLLHSYPLASAAGTQGHSATSPFPPGHPWAKGLGWRSPGGFGLPHNCDLFLVPLQEGFRGSFEVIPNLLAGN